INTIVKTGRHQNNAGINFRQMKKIVLLGAGIAIFFSSCVSQKKYAELEAKQKETQDLLNSATVKLNSCLESRSRLEADNQSLRSEKNALIDNMGNLTTLSKKGAENLEKSLESLRE